MIQRNARCVCAGNRIQLRGQREEPAEHLQKGSGIHTRDLPTSDLIRSTSTFDTNRIDRSRRMLARGKEARDSLAEGVEFPLETQGNTTPNTSP